MSLSSPISISAVNKDDLPALRELFLDTRIATFNWISSSSFLSEDFDQETEGEEIVVARYNKQIAGFISIWMPDQFIHHLYVAPAYHNMGAGTALLDTALSILKGQASLKCLVQNVRAIRFYRQYGFVENGGGNGPDGEYYLFTYKRGNANDEA